MTMNDLTNIATLMSGVTDIVLFIIAIYTFYLTFVSTKITVPSFGFSFNSWKSDSMHFVLKNKTLRAFTINEIYVVFDKQYRLKICKYDVPILLNPYQSIIIKMEPFTTIHDFSLHDFSKMNMDGKDIYLEIGTDENKILYSQIKGKKRQKYQDGQALNNAVISTVNFGDVVLRDDYAYILKYRVSENGEIYTAFINDGGRISTDVFGFNVIPKESLSDIESIKSIFADVCKELKIGLSIQNAKEVLGNWV